MRHSLALPVNDISQVGDARRTTARLTAELDLPEHERGLAAIIATELATNLAKYAKDGQLVIRALGGDSAAGIEILSLDSGPGLGNVAKYIADGYSSGGTTGNGLGAIQRLASQFDIYSASGVGTAVMARVVPASQPQGVNAFEFGVVCVPIKGEEQCGDSWGVYQDVSRGVFMLVDGLGHGAIAATAADEAVRIFEKCWDKSPTDILNHSHLALRSTRGAVMAVAGTSLKDGAVSYVGIGNIAACLLDENGPHHMISLNGTVGLAAKPRAYPYTWSKDGILIMSSDGLQSRWQLERFPGLLRRHPSLIAGMLYQNYSRGRDDVSVLAARWSQL